MSQYIYITSQNPSRDKKKNWWFFIVLVFLFVSSDVRIGCLLIFKFAPQDLVSSNDQRSDRVVKKLLRSLLVVFLFFVFKKKIHLDKKKS